MFFFVCLLVGSYFFQINVTAMRDWLLEEDWSPEQHRCCIQAVWMYVFLQLPLSDTMIFIEETGQQNPYNKSSVYFYKWKYLQQIGFHKILLEWLERLIWNLMPSSSQVYIIVFIFKVVWVSFGGSFDKIWKFWRMLTYH